ncbi:MAG TPA: hypothetical protein VGE74_27845 [Gemmata sp.]
MDCRDAQFYLRIRHRGADELGPDVTAPLNQHLDTCPVCAADARALGSFDRALGSAMVRVAVPAGLRDRLVSHVATKQTALFRRKVYRGAGAVVAALLLIGIGIGVFTNTRPKLDPDELARINGEQYADAEAATQKWLAEQKLPDRLPLPFDYDLFAFRGHESLKGQDVPVIVFHSRHGKGFAKVYLFPHDGRFDLKGAQEAINSHARAEVFTKQWARGSVTYVFVYPIGPDGLRPFLHNDGRPKNAA